METKIRKIVKRTFFAAMVASLSLASGFVLAQGGGGVKIPDPLNGATFDKILMGAAEAVGTLIGVLGSIMVIVAGILYLTSAGSPERMSTAKKALIYAIAGIVIGLTATSIVAFIKQVSGAK